jgi:CSLREA domain-containing protein
MLAAMLICALLLVLGVEGKHAHAATTFTVNSTADPGTSGCDATECTLREAIVAANSAAGDDTITFAIPSSDSNCNGTTGVCTIRPTTSDLPAITEAVTIDGYSQTGTSPATASSAAVLLIELDGENVGNGLRIQASNSTVKGLIINRFSNPGVWLQNSGATGNKVEGNFIGTDATGTAGLGN